MKKGWLLFALFPGCWIVAMILMCVTHAGNTATSLIGSLVGIITSLIALARLKITISRQICPNFKIKALSHVLAGALALVALLATPVVTMCIVQVRARLDDPIGLPRDTGWAQFPCTIREVKDVRDIQGDVAHLRFAICPVGYSSFDSYTYFVFVRKPAESNSRKTLALRYDSINGSEPDIRWSGPSELSISFYESDVDAITEEKTSVDGISVRYRNI